MRFFGTGDSSSSLWYFVNFAMGLDAPERDEQAARAVRPDRACRAVGEVQIRVGGNAVGDAPELAADGPVATGGEDDSLGE